MHNIAVIFKRELKGYFNSPIAYVVLFIWLVAASSFTFFFSGFFERGQADLLPFFSYHPWLFLILIPAISMRLWSEERKSGSIELLLTLPISMVDAVIGKFLAGWVFTGVCLFFTFPMWMTVSYLGDPDHGAIFAGYIGSFLMAGGFLAIGSCISAITKNQVIAFVVTAAVCFLVNLSGYPIALDGIESFLTWIIDWEPRAILDTIASFSFLNRFNDIMRGVISIRDVIYFLSLIALWLYANVVVIEMKKG